MSSRLAIITLAAVSVGCSSGTSGSTASLPPFDGGVAIGTWGGDGAAMIVGDTAMHIHVGCTFGDVSGRVPVSNNHFDVAGSYMLRAFPIAIGPTVPARFVGDLSGATARVTITVDDTVEHKTVILGPVSVTYGQDARLMPCPICRRPDLDRRSAIAGNGKSRTTR
jgi:hypothetical protein